MNLVKAMRWLCVGLLGITACDSASTEGRAGASSFRDSAGVSILEHAAPDLSAAPTWTVPDDPSWSLGVLEGDPNQQFFNVGDARVLDDGTLLVVDTGARELRFFDPELEHLRTVGGEGDGPGEYRRLTLVRPHRGDSLVVFDAGNGRVSFLDREGVFGRSISFSRESGGSSTGALGVGGGPPRYQLLDVFEDGTLLALEAGPPFSSGDSTRVERLPEQYLRMDSEGNVLDTFGTVPADEVFVWASDSGVAVGPLPFGRTTTVLPAGRSIRVGLAEGFQYDIRDGDGVIRTIVRVDDNARALPSEVAEAHRAERLEGMTNPVMRQMMEPQILETPYPETIAPYRRMVAADSGRTWIERSPDPGAENPPATWFVFDGDGAFEGWLRLPAGFELTQAGSDFVVGVRENELGIEYVEMYRVEVESP